MRLGVVGGTGWEAAGDGRVDVETPWGEVPLAVGRLGAHEAFFLQRHGHGPARPPHRIDHRANVWALAAARVDRVLAVASVGALRPEIAPGTLLVPDDVLDASWNPARTFHDDAPVHVDATEPYCPEVRAALEAGAVAAGGPVHRGGVYAATPGPRLETRAEARALARDAHVVGMTGAPEVALAREKGLCYAVVCVVANPAAGVAGPAALSARDIAAATTAARARVAAALAHAARALPEAKGCACARALDGARI